MDKKRILNFLNSTIKSIIQKFYNKYFKKYLDNNQTIFETKYDKYKKIKILITFDNNYILNCNYIKFLQTLQNNIEKTFIDTNTNYKDLFIEIDQDLEEKNILGIEF